MKKNDSGTLESTTETAVALTDDTTIYTDIESLNQQVKSMMEYSNNAAPHKKQGRARICKVCGKEGSWVQIRDHIEANHITGISIPCNLCGKLFKSRNSAINHKSVYHRND